MSNHVSQFTCRVYIVTCMHPLQVAVLLCTSLYRTVYRTIVQYLYFKPRMHWSKCKSNGDVAGTVKKHQLLYHTFEVLFSSVQLLSRVQLFATREPQHNRPPCLSPTPGVDSNSCPSSWWCHLAISSSVIPFSSCPQSLPASFPMSQFFSWGGQSIAVSASASVLPMNTQDWSPLGWTGWISLTIRLKMSFIFCVLLFMYCWCEKYYKSRTLQCQIADSVSWIVRLALLTLRTNWTYEHALGTELIHM